MNAQLRHYYRNREELLAQRKLQRDKMRALIYNITLEESKKLRAEGKNKPPKKI